MGDPTESGRRLRAKERKLYTDQDIDDDEIEGKRNYSILDKLQNNKCRGKFVKSMKGEDFTLRHVQEHGLKNPLVFYEKSGLGMRVPSENFKVAEVKQCVGSRRMLDVMDVNTQRGMEMSMKDWVRYYENPERDRLLNVISLEFSHTRLANYVESPNLVRQVDWVDRVWPRHLKECQTESTNVIDKMKYPKVQKYCLMSVGGCYTDFHIDFGGTSVWYHILHGEKVFWLIPPTEKNIAIYENWVLSAKQGDVFLADLVDSCEMITLKAGYTFIIPSGWIHAVYTPIDSLVFGGNFIHSFNILQQLRVAEVEDRTHVPQKFRYPFYNEILWYVLERYVCCISGKTYLKKHEKKKEELDEPPDSPNSSQFDEDSRPPSRNPDSRPPSRNPDDVEVSGKVKSEKDDTDKLSQRLTIELRRIDESSLKKANEEGESGTAQRARRKGAGELYKAGEDNSDESSSEKDFLKSVNGSGDLKDKKRVHYLTKYELEGLNKLVEWVENIPVQKRVVPKDLLNPDAVLQDIKQLLADHAADDQTLAITGEPICTWPESDNKKIKLFKPRMSGPKIAKGSSKQASGNRRRRTRCKKCEACTRSDCEECNFCKDMRKFGGPGRMKQSCISRQCMAPVLPNTAICMICEDDQRVKLPDSEETTTTLMECGICWEIVHPECLKKKFEQMDLEGVVNEDLPSSWECPKCCQDGKQGQIKPRLKPKGKIESRRSSEASESAYDTDDVKVTPIEGKRVVSKETPSPSISPKPGSSSTFPSTSIKIEENEKKPQIPTKKHKITPTKEPKEQNTPNKKLKVTPAKSVKSESPSVAKRSGRSQKRLPGDEIDLNIKRPKRESVSPDSIGTDSPSTARRQLNIKTDSPNPRKRGDRQKDQEGRQTSDVAQSSEAGTSNKAGGLKMEKNSPFESKVPKLRKGDTQGPLTLDKDKELRLVLEKCVVRPAPLPPPPSHVEQKNGKKHILNRLLWMKIFAYLENSDLCHCMSVCKTWNWWCLDRKLWKTIDLSRKRLKQVHLVGIVKRQPANLILVSSVISQKQLVWLVSRLPQLQTLDLTYCSWATICGLCSSSCPFLRTLLLKWAVGIRENCFRDLVLPPVDLKPGLKEVSRLTRMQNLDLSGCEITDQSLELIVQYMPKLEKLGLSYCMRLTDEGIEKLFIATSPLKANLAILDLSGCCQLTEKSIILAFKSCTSLKSLNCKSCPKITQVICQKFVDSFSQRRATLALKDMLITAQRKS